MLISKRNTETEKKLFSSNEEIMEAEELLYNIINSSLNTAGDNFEIEENGHRKGLRSLYYECRERLEKISTIGSKADFLTMAVLENMFNSALPLLMFSVQDYLEGNDKPLQDSKRLQGIFESNPLKQIWKQKNDSYVSMLSTMGITLKNPSTSFNQMVDPLLDAFGFYHHRNNIYKVRTGAKSLSRPVISANVCRYSSEKEFADIIQKCGQENVLMFGAVEKTFMQTTDYFYEWYRGYPEERMRNWMNYNKLSREEYLNSADKYSRAIYLGIKSAETIWLMEMPYRTGSYGGTYDDCSAKYVYGRRAGYAPYEIFFKDTPPAAEGTHFISLQSGGWTLNELMDDEAKVWLPAFIEETIDYFFSSETSEPESTNIISPEEMAASYITDEEKQWIVPVVSAPPAVTSFHYEIPNPEELFDEDYLLKLFQYFGIGQPDIKDAPILPYRCSSYDDAADVTEKHVQSAYIKVLADKIADFLSGNIEPTRRIILEHLFDDKEEILNKALSGSYSEYRTVLVDGTVEKDADGREKATVFHTKKDDGRVMDFREMLSRPELPFVIWKGTPKDTKPPVVWKLSFETAKGYADLFGTPEDQMADIFRLSGSLKQFWKDFKNILPDSITSPYPFWYGRKTRSVYFPDLANINICMTKTEYKKILKEMGGPH